jgi:salicylate hydroxylase
MVTDGPPVMIVGAGIGGLTLALLLRRQGIHAEVLEQSAELREVGAAVALAANGTRVLAHLGLAGALTREGTEPTVLIHRDGRDGHVIAATQDSQWYRDTFGAPFVGLHRRALQRLLVDALGTGQVHLDCRVEAVQLDGAVVRLRCASGAVFEASLVVGADGVHSLVRDWVCGVDQPLYSGTSGFRGLVPAGQLCHMPDPGALQFWMGPGAHLLHYPIGGGQLINFLAVVDEPARWTAPGWMEPAEPGAHLKAFAGWHPAVRELIGGVPQSPRWGLFARRPLARWHRGPVVLLGDAAHAMLPHQGQGANQTIEDAFVLAEELGGGSDVQAALCRYVTKRRVRTRKVQLMSWAASAALHLPDGAAAQRRDAYLARLPERLAWIHGHDVLSPSPFPTAEAGLRGPNGPVSRTGTGHGFVCF